MVQVEPPLYDDVTEVRPSSTDDVLRPLEGEGALGSKRKRRNGQFAAWMRWLHIYLSMFSFTALLFFSVTGITLNHPDWFYGDVHKVVELQGKMDVAWLNLDIPQSGVADDSGEEQSDFSRQVAKLEIVEYLRNTHGIRGAVSELSADEYQCVVIFKGPGYGADAFIDRESGEYDLTVARQGVVAVMNDLHKGRDSGSAWSWVIDISALAMTLVSATGLVLLLYLKRRRVPGLLTFVLGTVVLVIVYLVWVP